MSISEMRCPARPLDRWLPAPLLAFLALFLLLASGRLASVDAGNQLGASILWVQTGSPSTTEIPAGNGLWVQNAGGRYYQAHDLGNVVLMLPAALLTRFSHATPIEELVWRTPVVICLAGALTYALFSALGCWWMYLLLVPELGGRRAFLLALALPAVTLFGPYARAAWDVMGAAVMVCGMLLAWRRREEGRHPAAHAVLAAAALAGACTFRYSLGPFLVPALAFVLWRSPSSTRGRDALLAGLAFGLGMVPTLLYNYIRMGSPLRPATTAAAYISGPNSFEGSPLLGALGLLFSPARGLFVFCPFLLLALGFPWLRSAWSPAHRRMVVASGIGVAGYVLLIGGLKHWATFGWGPRYLVPMVPLLFYPACLVFAKVRGWARGVGWLLFGASLFTGLPPLLANWSLMLTSAPAALWSDLWSPWQIELGWRTLLRGLAGLPLPTPAAVAGDAVRSNAARFPDLWLARLMETSSGGRWAGWAIGLTLLVLFAWSARRALRAADDDSDVARSLPDPKRP